MQRFILDTATLAGAVSMAGIGSATDSVLPGPAKANQRKLASAGVLEGGSLAPEFAAALTALANPPRVLTVNASGAGRPDWVETRFVPSPDTDAVVAWTKRDGDYDIAVIGARSAAVLLVDQLLKMTDLPTGEPDARYELSVAAYVALLAASDVMQQAALRSRLDRKIRQVPPVFVPAAMAELVVQGLEQPDTRWAVSAGALTSPAPFPTDAESMSAGLEELRSAGIVRGRSTEVRLTAAGVSLTDSFSRIINLGSLQLSLPASESATARVTIYRCMASIWAGVWGYDDGDGSTRVTLLELDHRAALGIIETMLGDLAVTGRVVAPIASPSPPEAPPTPNLPAPPEAPPTPNLPAQDKAPDAFCGKCGTPYKIDTDFCTGCGTARA